MCPFPCGAGGYPVQGARRQFPISDSRIFSTCSDPRDGKLSTYRTSNCAENHGVCVLSSCEGFVGQSRSGGINRGLYDKQLVSTFSVLQRNDSLLQADVPGN